MIPVPPLCLRACVLLRRTGVGMVWVWAPRPEHLPPWLATVFDTRRSHLRPPRAFTQGLSPGSGCRGENLLEGIALPQSWAPGSLGLALGLVAGWGGRAPRRVGGCVWGSRTSARSQPQGSLVFPLGWDLGAPLGGLGAQEAWQGFRGAAEGSPHPVLGSGLLLPQRPDVASSPHSARVSSMVEQALGWQA